MFHQDRTWCVTPVESAEELARKLTTVVWTCCTAFELSGYLWLNDSTSPDGAAEFAVLKRQTPDGRMLQVESITFGWCSRDESLTYIQQALRGEFDANDFAREVQPRLQTPQEHGRCHHCA